MFKKAAFEQGTIKVRQNSQNVSLLSINWQYTLSPRTKSGVPVTDNSKQSCIIEKPNIEFSVNFTLRHIFKELTKEET